MNDIHRLDGMLPPFEFLINYNGTSEEKELIKDLLKLPLSTSALESMNLLIGAVGTDNGFDFTNRISIDHLLYELATLIPSLTKDNIDIIEEYMIELKSGSCREGRSHRLRQILFALRS